jgi:hypothetical protein
MKDGQIFWHVLKDSQEQHTCQIGYVTSDIVCLKARFQKVITTKLMKNDETQEKRTDNQAEDNQNRQQLRGHNSPGPAQAGAHGTRRHGEHVPERRSRHHDPEGGGDAMIRKNALGAPSLAATGAETPTNRPRYSASRNSTEVSVFV